MRRHILGILAIAFLLVAAALWLWPPGEHYVLLEGMGWRLGALLAVWWLAYPDVDRLPGWLLVGLPVLVLVILVRPKWALLALLAMIVLAILKPRLQRR